MCPRSGQIFFLMFIRFPSDVWSFNNVKKYYNFDIPIICYAPPPPQSYWASFIGPWGTFLGNKKKIIFWKWKVDETPQNHRKTFVSRDLIFDTTALKSRYWKIKVLKLRGTSTLCVPKNRIFFCCIFRIYVLSRMDSQKNFMKKNTAATTITRKILGKSSWFFFTNRCYFASFQNVGKLISWTKANTLLIKNAFRFFVSVDLGC